jgi:urease accessory protein
MHALARVVAEADGRGGTRLARLRGEPPLLLRAGPTRDGSALVHLVGGAAGPLGGDDLHLHIEVRENAVLELRTVAASIALPARSAAASRMTMTVTVAAGATLRWLPEQLVAATGCRHRAHADITLAEGARLLWRDELICGRHDEPAGNLAVSTVVDYAGQALLRQSLEIGPDADGFAGPAVLGGAKATGSLLRVDPATVCAVPAVLAPTAVRMPLAGGPADLITATAPDAHTLRGYLAC